MRQDVSGMKNANNSKGFTLVEMAIVIALMTILATIAVPAWKNYKINMELKTATRQIMTDIMQARLRAIAENVDIYQISFNVSDNSYSLQRSDTGATLWTKNLTAFGSENRLWFAWFWGSGSTNVLKFQRRGTMTQGWIFVRNTLSSYSRVRVQIVGRTNVEYFLQK